MTQRLPKNDDIVNAALELADADVPVFPVSLKKTPAISKKRVDELFGDGKYGFHMASTDPDKIEVMFTERSAGIGMPTGKVSNCTVIDVDCGKGKKNRDEAVAWLNKHRESALWGSSVVRTGSGGLHYYCRYTPGVMNAASVWADGVDCRNDGGYVVIPPFMGYQWVRQLDRDDWPAPPPVPENRRKGHVDVPEERGETPPQIVEMRRLIREGVTWHEPVRDIVAHLVGSGWSDAEILQFCFQWTWAGYDARETFETMCVMIEGARRKWGEKHEPNNTDQARIDQIAELWNRCSPDARKFILGEVLGEGGKGE